jgi:alkylated DNA repair dioxygenase AlkB
MNGYLSKPLVHLENGGHYFYEPHFYSYAEAEALGDISLEVNWGHHKNWPRYVAWVGDFDYSYSGITHKATPWTPRLQAMREKVEKFVFGTSEGQYNGVLLNLYRDEKDSVALHCDDEETILKDSPIASVSLGAPREFVLSYDGPNRPKPKNIKMILGSGSLLIMGGSIQRFWKHGIPKEKNPVGPRINLTFRQYQPIR